MCLQRRRPRMSRPAESRRQRSAGGIRLKDTTSDCFLSKRGTEIIWPIKEGALISTAGKNRSNHIVSAWHFRDADIHAEFLLPETGTGNSALYVHGNDELQIIDSFGKEDLGEGDAGGIYGFAKPLVNASKPRDQWQVYDVRYIAAARKRGCRQYLIFSRLAMIQVNPMPHIGRQQQPRNNQRRHRTHDSNQKRSPRRQCRDQRFVLSEGAGQRQPNDETEPKRRHQIGDRPSEKYAPIL